MTSPRLAFPRICIALGFAEPDALLAHARHEIESGESFLEFRLDYLNDPARGVELIRNLQRENPDCTILATCRHQAHHGRFRGSIEEQVRILRALAGAGARAVDLEIESAEALNGDVAGLRQAALLVISYHNFESTPAMGAVLKRMLRVPADAYKVVPTARKMSDVLRLLDLSKANPRTPLVLLSMGEIGAPARVLANAFGSLYTYAAPQKAEGTAPGQMSARALRQLYRADKLSKSAKVYGVIADPVRHSLSPQIHNRAFQARRLDAVYLPFLVPPTQLRDFVNFASELPVHGFSVTIPHKQKIIRYLDIVDPLARRIGAVNTVWRKAGRWRGMNTDVAGVIGPLSKRMRLTKASVLLAGTGGAARGAAFALTDAGAKVSIVGRTPAKAQALAKACGAEAVDCGQLSSLHFDAVVHATPLGMSSHSEGCFFSDVIPGDIVFDMVYNPLETTLTRRAKEQGKTVIPGLEMFIEQAAHQFETWTGEQAPRAVMERAALEALQ